MDERRVEMKFKPPPVLVGERVVWLGSGSGLPLSATVRWMGKLVEMGPDWIVGLELDKPMPYGGIDGYWGKRKLFSCEPKHGLLVPVDKIMKESLLLKQRHSFDHDGARKKNNYPHLQHQLSLPQSKNEEEFITKVLPQPIATKAFSSSSYSSDSSETKLAPLSIANVKTHELAYVNTADNDCDDVLKVKKYQDSLQKYKKEANKTIKQDTKRTNTKKGYLEPINEVVKQVLGDCRKQERKKEESKTKVEQNGGVVLEERCKKQEKSPKKDRRKEWRDKKQTSLEEDHDYETITFGGGETKSPTEKSVLKGILKIPKTTEFDNILFSDALTSQGVKEPTHRREHRRQCDEKDRRHKSRRKKDTAVETLIQVKSSKNSVESIDYREETNESARSKRSDVELDKKVNGTAHVEVKNGFNTPEEEYYKTPRSLLTSASTEHGDSCRVPLAKSSLENSVEKKGSKDFDAVQKNGQVEAKQGKKTETLEEEYYKSPKDLARKSTQWIPDQSILAKQREYAKPKETDVESVDTRKIEESSVRPVSRNVADVSEEYYKIPRNVVNIATQVCQQVTKITKQDSGTDMSEDFYKTPRAVQDVVAQGARVNEEDAGSKNEENVGKPVQGLEKKNTEQAGLKNEGHVGKPVQGLEKLNTEQAGLKKEEGCQTVARLVAPVVTSTRLELQPEDAKEPAPVPSNIKTKRDSSTGMSSTDFAPQKHFLQMSNKLLHEVDQRVEKLRQIQTDKVGQIMMPAKATENTSPIHNVNDINRDSKIERNAPVVPASNEIQLVSSFNEANKPTTSGNVAAAQLMALQIVEEGDILVNKAVEPVILCRRGQVSTLDTLQEIKQDNGIENIAEEKEIEPVKPVKSERKEKHLVDPEQKTEIEKQKPVDSERQPTKENMMRQEQYPNPVKKEVVEEATRREKEQIPVDRPTNDSTKDKNVRQEQTTVKEGKTDVDEHGPVEETTRIKEQRQENRPANEPAKDKIVSQKHRVEPVEEPTTSAEDTRQIKTENVVKQDATVDPVEPPTRQVKKERIMRQEQTFDPVEPVEELALIDPPTRQPKREKIAREEQSVPQELIGTMDSLDQLAHSIDEARGIHDGQNGEFEIVKDSETTTPTPSLRRRKEIKISNERLSTIEEDVIKNEEGELVRRCARIGEQEQRQNINNTEIHLQELMKMSQAAVDSQDRARVRSNGSTGFFSFLRWFKRNKEHELKLNIEDFKVATSVPSSPLLLRGRVSSCNSIDTLFSIATVSSFAFVSPSQYQPSTSQQQGEDTVERRKKRRAPDPPGPPVNSLPNTLEHKKQEPRHRRTVSESYKDRSSSGSYCHVRGKKKAPPPPPTAPTVDNLYPSLDNKSTGRRKRQAPPPPLVITPTDGRLSTIERDQIITNIDRIQELTQNTVEAMGQQTTTELQQQDEAAGVVCNDTLRLEKGMLKPNKPIVNNKVVVPEVTPSSPVSPRPWYKRSVKETGSSIKRDIFKSLEKKKDGDDWMPEVGYSRPHSITSEPGPSRFNIFARLDSKTEKKEEKRKSQVAMLANISELDREAAEIVKKGQEAKTNDDEMYYSYTDVPFVLTAMSDTRQQDHPQEVPKPNSTKELISLFNAISSVASSGTSFLFGDKRSSVREPTPPSPRKFGEESEETRWNKRIGRRSPSPSIPTITELSESSPSTINNYDETKPRMWTCPRCTLENPKWRIICDACSCRRTDKRKSEMEIDIDWEKELKKYFPNKEECEVSGKLTLDKQEGEVKIETKYELKQDEEDVEQIRRARLAYLNKHDSSTNTNGGDPLRKNIDHTEKLKLKEMLKDMKNSLPKTDSQFVVNNKYTKNDNAVSKYVEQSSYSSAHSDDVDLAAKYGAIKKQKVKKERQVAEALLVTTTTVFEDIIVKKHPGQVGERRINNATNGGVEDVVLPVSVETFSTNVEPKQTKNGMTGTFELMRAKDLVDIVATKTGNKFPATRVYENMPNKVFNKSKNGVMNLSLQQPHHKTNGYTNNDDLFRFNIEEELVVEKEFEDIFKKEFASSRSSSVSSDSSELERLTNKLTHAQGLADFKADVKSDVKMNTLAVNRLLKKLEVAIADGQHLQAAGLAKELAKMKISCSVIRQRKSSFTKPMITVDLYVEDKVSHQGPIPLQVQADMTVAELKVKVEMDLEIPVKVQRWILGKSLASDDLRTLQDHDITSSGCPVFLYLVAPDPEIEVDEPKSQQGGENQLDEAAGTTRQQFGKGWYYNYEEDRYSYCDSDESREQSPDKVEKAVRVIQKTIETAKSKTSPDKGENISRKEERRQSRAGAGKPRSIFDLLKPDMNESIKKDLKVITINSVRETVEKLNSSHISATKKDRLEENGTLVLGWKCSVCTLVNPPTRPGCSACTTERPVNYVVPMSYRANEQELSRIRREQHVDNEMKKHPPGADISATTAAAGLATNGSDHYLQLVNLDNADLVANTEEFECSVCLIKYKPGEGVILRECLHTFCRQCLVNIVQFTEEAEIKCPYRDDSYACDSVLQEREIKALVPKRLYEQHLAKSVSEAENKINNAFHCKTPDCTGWCILEDNVNIFHCPVCRRTNCLTCQMIHDNVDCRQYQENVKESSETNVEARRTREMLEEMVDRGEAMACPTCQVVLMKKWGCDWLRCSMCKTEICWVSRKPRWGPAGKGDTTGGCQCGVNGVKCHPKCNYCH